MSASEDYNPLAAYQEPSLSEGLRALAADKGVRIYLLLVLLLIAAIAVLYARSLWNPLVFDDANDLNEGLAGVAASPFALRPRWLALATFGWTYAYVGVDWFWHRVVNLGLHAATTVLLFAFFFRLLQAVLPQGDRAQQRILAFFGALLFAWHPVSVYGVAYLLQRSTVMATLFGTAALLCYLEGLTRAKARWFVGALFCYLLALSSKEHVVMLPGVAIAISLLLRKPAFANAKKLWLPAVALGGIGVALLLVMKARGVIGTAYEPTAFEIFSQMRRRELGPTLDNAYPLSIITQGHLFFQYLLLWIAPYTGWMSIDVRQPFALHLMTWPQTAGFVAFLVYPVISVRLLLKGGQRGLLGLGMLFPWVLFLTELTTVRVTELFVLYRNYLWTSGLPLVPIAIFASSQKKTAVRIGAALVCLGLAPLALNRLATFSDELHLWSDAVEVNRGKMNQGAERPIWKRGFAHLAAERYDEALKDFSEGNSLNTSGPGFANVGDRGIVYFQFNHLEKLARDRAKLAEQTKAIEAAPDSGVAYMERAATWFKLLDRPDLAVDDYTRAIDVAPTLEAEARAERAKAQIQLGNPRLALADVNKAIEIRPRLAQAYMVRGTIHAMNGDATSSLRDFETAVRLDPKDPEIRFGIGNLLAAVQRFPEALDSFGKAVELNPKLADAYANRGSIYMFLNRPADAIAEYGKALAADPDHGMSYFNRGRIFMQQSRTDEAIDDFVRGLNVDNTKGEDWFDYGLLLLDKKLTTEARFAFQRSCQRGHAGGCDRFKELSR